MPLSLALISQTGNVMKTTLAAALAIRFAADNLNTIILDLDREHRERGASIANWFADRKKIHPERPLAEVVIPTSAEEAIDYVEKSPADIAILDCPSRATEASYLVAAGVDFTVLPLVPGNKDATLTEVTLRQMLTKGVDPRKVAVLMTRTGTDSEAAEFQAWLRALKLGITVIDAHIPERTAYRNALSKHLSIVEAPQVSLRVQARTAVDAVIQAFDQATLPATPERITA
jgi:cellulose biosynthesis protein BcsQ